jgi:hypothetical protein
MNVENEKIGISRNVERFLLFVLGFGLGALTTTIVFISVVLSAAR